MGGYRTVDVVKGDASLFCIKIGLWLGRSCVERVVVRLLVRCGLVDQGGR